MDNSYFLRQNISGRDTEIAIAITLYNVSWSGVLLV